MKAIWKRVLLCLLLLAWTAAQCPTAVLAADSAPGVFYLAGGEQEADGSWTPEYWTDARGNRVEETVNRVRTRASANLPSRYDLRDYGLVTSVKYQAGAGCCWAFGTIASLESSYIRQGFGTVADTDFSEAHLTWFGLRQRTTDTSDPTYGDGLEYTNPFISGGNWNRSSSALMRGSGLQLEANAPWVETSSAATMMQQMSQAESDRYVSYARMWSATNIRDNSPDALKQKLMQNGAAILSYYDDTTTTRKGYRSDTHSYYQTAVTSKTNHVVAVVGWDDSYAIENFNESPRPTSPGAWLVKGSWSKAWGDKGYYWISYEDPSLKEFTSFVAAPADIYDHIYQYDGGYPRTYFTPSTSGKMANVFTAQRDEWLTHVAFYSPNATPISVTAEVYVAPEGFRYGGTDPVTGMTRVAEATTNAFGVEYGYSTLKLASPVHLQQGVMFTVVLTMKTTEATIMIPVEGQTTSNPGEGDVTFTGEIGTSFIGANGYWYDTNDYINHQDFNNVPLKAMTCDAEPVEHSYGAPEWTWSDDHGSADAVFTCTDCGDTLTLHAPIKTNVLSPLSCETDLIVSYTATVQADGVDYSDTTEAITLEQMPGHAYDITVTAPTCTEGGRTTYTCDYCGSSYTTDETDPLGHDFGVWTAEKPIPAEGAVLQTRTCARCSEEETRESDDTLIVEIDDAHVLNRAGRTVRVPVYIRRNPGVISTRLHLEYDPTQLRLTGAENGEVLSDDVALFGGDLSAVPYTVQWCDAQTHTDYTGTGLLVTFVFEVLPGADASVLPILLSYAANDTLDVELHDVPVCVVPGSVELVDRIPGDVNDDGSVDLVDVTLLCRYLAGGWDVTILEVNADVNGSGTVDLKDAVLIRRFLAGGWDITLV